MPSDLQPTQFVELLTGYPRGDNEDLGFGWTISLAQTFVITEPTYVFRSAALLFTKIGKPGIHAYLTHANPHGRPVGAPIVTAWREWKTNYEEPYARWWVHEFRPVPLLSPGNYAVIYETLNPGHFMFWRWRLDENPAPPPVQPCWRSLNMGGTWNQLPEWTFMHELWGWHPPPNEEPPPETIYWAPIKEVEAPWSDTVTIVVTTESACHLYMRWTLEPPLKHKISRVVRGITLSTETRYCFVAWHENEQIEDGDTLVHTFVKPNWPICQTRYFYFIGSKQRIESPSASPIFFYHHQRIELESQIISPDGDTDINEHRSTDAPSYLSVLQDDSTWVPPNGGGTWGIWTGHFIWKNWYPWGYHTDLYTFTDPTWCDLPIDFLVVHYRLGRDTYPWGTWSPVLRVTGTIYQGAPQDFPVGIDWRHHTWYTNPATGDPWTQDEVAALEAGIMMNKVGSFGNVFCDAIHIELRY